MAGMLSGKYDFSKENELQPTGRFFSETNLSIMQQRRLNWYVIIHVTYVKIYLK